MYFIASLHLSPNYIIFNLVHNMDGQHKVKCFLELQLNSKLKLEIKMNINCALIPQVFWQFIQD